MQIVNLVPQRHSQRKRMLYNYNAIKTNKQQQKISLSILLRYNWNFNIINLRDSMETVKPPHPHPGKRMFYKCENVVAQTNFFIAQTTKPYTQTYHIAKFQCKLI